MKKILMAIASAALACSIGFAAVGCGNSDAIVVCGREASSGTREAFDKIVANADGKTLEEYGEETNPDGAAEGGYVSGAQYFNGTGLVANKVASTKGAIGYISLSSVDDTVKALTVEGVAASTQTVLVGDYAIQRPFVITTRKEGNLTPVVSDFLDFLQSDDAQKVVEEEGLVSLTETDDRNGEALGTYDAKAEAPAEVTDNCVVIRGSTSMEDVITALVGEYCEINSAWIDDSAFSISLNGSSEGRDAAKNDTVGNVIGLASSASSSDSERYCFYIALDAVAVVVNPDNELSNITLAQLYDIYTGAVTKWSDLTGSAE